VHREPYILACCCDFAGQVRGKGFPASDLETRWTKGVGWTPTNIMINCFGEIPSTPWGASGDLVLRPDPAGEIRLDFGGEETVEHLILGSIENMDGSSWACCPRSYATRALDDLRNNHGLVLRASFEHEFTVTTIEPRLGGAYGLEAVRQIGALPEVILAAAERANLAPDTFLPEYSPGQFEMTLDPALGVEAADRAVKLRQLIRAAALRCGHRVSFSPIMHKDGVGNGVHIHFSLETLKGEPVSYDAGRPHGISEVAGKFVAGVLAHGRELCAITAPSVISYERLRPNAWSASFTNLGVRDREALVRVCPVSEKPGANVASAFNFEFRAADSAASPYLALGALVRAGMDGIASNRILPKPVSASDAAKLPDEEREVSQIELLPQSLDEALDMLDGDAILMEETMRIPYVMHKRGQIRSAASAPGDQLFKMYAQAY